jgi:hypothetical protein
VRSDRTISGHKGEQGIVILLVAVVLLFVVGAMAALAIDLVTFYTARSEAQLAASGAALAGARVLANSGMTSLPSDTTLASNAETLATTIATQVARNNEVGGRKLNAGEVTVSFPNAGSANFGSNPQVNVQVSRNDLPTFFARIWGRTAATVAVAATAEAYNASGLNTAPGLAPPVAPTCVKPWLLPNIDPSLGPGNTIFNATTGAITHPGLLGWTDPNSPALFVASCASCTSPFPTPSQWQYYPGASSDFPAPTELPACNVALTNPYQRSMAGCVQTPIACNSTIHIDTLADAGRNSQTGHAVNCLTHSLADQGDTVDSNPALTAGQPFRFLAGDDNPVASAVGQDTLVSDSLVTVPVFNSPTTSFSNPAVTVIGFVQLFLNPDGAAAPVPPAPNPGHIKTTIVNLVGCGTNATGPPILGNGASPVPVRLISTP